MEYILGKNSKTSLEESQCNFSSLTSQECITMQTLCQRLRGKLSKEVIFSQVRVGIEPRDSPAKSGNLATQPPPPSHRHRFGLI